MINGNGAHNGAHRPNAAPRRRLERVSTRDVQVPLSADDPEMLNGWRCVEIPPTNDVAWFILDSSHDRRTTWGRFV